MSKWIPVGKRLPEDELERVLVFSDDIEGGWRQQFVAWPGIDEDDPYWLLDQPASSGEKDIRIPFVTHWKPLEAEPK